MAGLAYPLMLALSMLALPTLYVLYKRSENFPKIVAISRALIILLLVGAAAQPYVNTEQELSETPEVTVLKDESTSTSLLEDQELEFEDVNMKERTIASANRSDLRNGLSRHMKENTNYLVLSDFQSTSSLDGIGEEFNRMNSTLNTIRYDTKTDTAVSIEGPSTSVPGAENKFTVEVSSTDSIPTPEIQIDGQEVQPIKTANDTWEVTETFDSEGSHTVKASIAANDTFGNNNEYYHAIDVTEKPKILFVGDEGPLGQKLSDFYDIEYRNSLPEDLSPYYSIILTKKVDEQALTPYVTEGNGVVYTGKVQDGTMDILPVKRADPASLTDATKTVLAIDNSEYIGTEQEDERGTILKLSKAVIEGLETNNRVGIVFYNSSQGFRPNAGILRHPKPLSRNEESLKRGIAGLKPGGVAFHDAGLKAAKQVVNGSGNIILLTDGFLPSGGAKTFRSSQGYQIQKRSYQIADKLESELIIVQAGKPSGKENQKRAQDFLNGLESRSGGDKYTAGGIINNGEAINLLGGGGTEGQQTPVTAVRDDHFITERIEMDTSVIEVDPAESKRGSKELARVSNGNPFLTVWRYGIGRVAAYSADGEQLENAIESDPLLVSRSVAWTVGDPKRKQEDWIRIESARQPEKVEIRSSNEIEGFKRQEKNLYTREFKPNSTGFGKIEEKFYSYNYPQEYEEVGYSEEMDSIVSSTGGEVYSPNDEESIKEDIKNFSEKTTVKRQQLGSFFIAAALLIFLAEVGYRKVNGKK